MDNIKIIIGRGNPRLGHAIAKEIGVEPTKCRIEQFSDGELKILIEESIRGKDVFVIQSTQPPAENLLELLLLIDAVRRASAWRITAVIPYFSYSRQERKDKPRVPISAKLFANLIVAAGANRVLTLDLHSAAIQGFFDIPTDHLTSDLVFCDFARQQIIKNTPLENIVIVSPDIGGVRKVENMASDLGVGIAAVYKRRSREDNKSVAIGLIGDVNKKVAIIRDDIIDTAGSIKDAAELLKTHGAEYIAAFGTHAVFSGNAIKNLEESKINHIIVTDSIPLKDDVAGKLKSKEFSVISIAPLFAKAIMNIHNEHSVSVLFEREK